MNTMLTAVFGAEAQRVPDGFEWKAEGSGVTITQYTGDAAQVVIPGRIQDLPVTAIGEEAFAWCEGLAE